MACVAFRLFSRRLSPLGCLYGVCRLPVSRSWRVSLSYFALHFVFIDCVAYKLFSWGVSPSGCFYGVCRLQVVYVACVAFRLFSRRLPPLEVVSTAFVAFRLAVSGVCRFHSSFMVYFIFCSPFSVHSACRLQLARACTTLKLL